MYAYSVHFIIGSLLFFGILACKNEKAHDIKPSGIQFPLDWLGYWEGDLKIYNDTGLSMNIAMALDLDTLSGDSLLQWTLIYDLDGNKDERKYFLKPVERNKGHWVTDEDNSIMLDGFVLDNGYYTSFEVGSNRIETAYILSGEEMIFENRVTQSDTLRVSGETTQDGEKIPSVRSYRVSGLQKAKLVKTVKQ